MHTWVYIVSYVLKERWPKIHDESICRLNIARIQIMLLGISRLHGEHTELNYHDYLVETSLVTGTMATRWAREQLRQTVANPCTGSASILAREAGQGLFVLLRYPQTGAGNCQAPARGRATISLTIGNGHHWQLRANNGFRFKFKYHVINCERAWQVFQLSAVASK